MSTLLTITLDNNASQRQRENFDYKLCISWEVFILKGFYALHGMQTRTSDENYVCPFVFPSVRLFVCQTRGLWQNGKKICPDSIPYEKSFSKVFWEEWFAGATPSAWNLWLTSPCSEIADFQLARSASAVTPSEKV